MYKCTISFNRIQAVSRITKLIDVSVSSIEKTLPKRPPANDDQSEGQVHQNELRLEEDKEPGTDPRGRNTNDT